MANLFRMRVNIDYLRFLVKRNRRFIVLMSVAMLVVFPVLYLTTLAISPNSSTESLRIFGQVLDLLLLIVSAIILPIISFSYMNHKKDLDVYHALPIKQGDLFITHALASIFLMTFPFIIGWLTGNLLSLDTNFTWLNMVENGIASLFIAYSISAIVTLALVHVGTSADGIIYAALLNVLPIVAYLSYNLFRSIVFLGFNQDISMRVIGLLFPIWSLFENNLEYSNRMFDSSILNGIYWLIWTVIIYSISRLIYLNRKHEKAESAFTNSYFFPVISSFFMILLIFIMYSTFYTLSSAPNQSYYALANFIFPFFFAGLVYLVMDTISQRSFKHLFKAMLKYLVIALAGFALLFVGLFSRSFNFVSRIPDPQQVVSIEFKLQDYENRLFQSDFTYNNYNEDFDTTTITDSEGIQTIIDLHQLILDEYAWIDYSSSDLYRYNSELLISSIESQEGYTKSYIDYPYDVSNFYNNVFVSFVYELEGGQKIAREYYIPYQWTLILYELFDSPAIINYVAPSLAYSDVYSTVKSASIREYSNENLVNIENLDLIKLREAYEKDMTLWTKDTFTQLQGQTIATLNLKVTHKTDYIESDITLSNLTPNTNAYLSSLVDFPSPSSDAQFINLIIYEKSDNSMIFHCPTTSCPWYYETIDGGVDYVSLTPELYLAILPYTTQYGISEEPLLTIIVEEPSYSSIELDDYGYLNTMLIKPEYEGIVLELIKDEERHIANDLFSFNMDTEIKY